MVKFEKYKKVDKKSYGSINDFLKKRSLLTTREWMVSELIKDFRRESDGSIPMTEVGEKLPDIFPFMEKKYSASEVSNAKHSLEKKVKRAGTTFLYSLEKGVIKEEDLEEMISEIAINIQDISEVLDEEPSEELMKKLPSDLRDIIEKINEIKSGEELELNSPLFGEYIKGELGKKWVEEISSDEFGEVCVKLVFDRPLSKNDILVPENLEKNESKLTLDRGYGFRNNGRFVERYSVEIID